MPGPAPKAAAVRRNHHPPLRGEWIDLPTALPKTPTLPNRGKGRGSWSARTRRAWKAWWRDPACTQWGPADLDLLEHLADIHEEYVRERRTNTASEIRQVRDSLGLTPKGKQDRRWRVRPIGEVVEMTERKSAASRMEELRQRAAAAERSTG